MSERGSFVTEYIYCPKCLEILLKAFKIGKREKYLCAVQIPSWIVGEELPVIAGKVGGTFDDDECDTIQQAIKDIKEKTCHPVKVLISCASGNSFIMELIPETEFKICRINKE